MKITRFAVIGLSFLSLISCDRHSQTGQPKQDKAVSAAAVLNTQWTDAAAKLAEASSNRLLGKGKPGFSLPQLRVYDPGERLILNQSGNKPGTLAATMQRVITADRPIVGPTFPQTVGDLQTADHGAATGRIVGKGKTTIFDYWADWCVPCKALEKELIAWAATQPVNSVQIVRVEADLTKLARDRGEKVIMIKKDASGNLVKVEM
ncbi:MAG: thioredoxin domain-containing protein [Sphingomicrobium sp.]